MNNFGGTIRVGIGPFSARFRDKFAHFLRLHKLTRSVLRHCTSTAPLLTFLLTVHAAIYIDVSNGTCSPSFKLALASGFHIIAAMSDVTQLLNAIDTDDPKAADQLLPLVYEELRKLAAQRMAQEKPGQTLQATALVHEAWL